MKASDHFFQQVYDVVRLIPSGRVSTYGAIARYLGSGRSARVVGWALNLCHSSASYIPAHRVVNRQGLLTGKRYFGNSSTMKQLLQNEGIEVVDDQISNFEDVFWDPISELGG